MSFWALLSLIPGVSHLALGLYVLIKTPKKALNIVFVLLAMSLAIWSLAEFVHRLDVSPTIAYVFIRISGLGWTYMSSLIAHFALLLCRREKILKKKITYIILYLPSTITLILFLFTDLIYEQEPTKLFFGYTALPGSLIWIYFLQYFGYYSVVIYFFIHIIKNGISMERDQASPVFFGSTTFMVLTTATNVLFPHLEISAPELGSTISLIWAVSVSIAVLKYKLFIIEPSSEGSMDNPLKYKLEPGLTYLTLEEKPVKGYDIFYDQITHNFVGLCLTKLKPERVKKNYKLIKTPVVWVTFRDKDFEKSISPKEVERLTLLVSEYIRENNNSVVMFDCIDQIKFAIGFNKTISMLRDLKKLCKETQAKIVFSVPQAMFDENHLSEIQKELEVAI
ncbi:DUF835 domain-containing protein [Candidatus Poribacteria bacterium]|nr:DUF835 domain-containing protein [Candidatus Poribacteria bacterium]